MQIHEIKPTFKKRSKKRIGRGGKRGTYSGKGLKGQRSRAGRKLKPEWKKDIGRLPKLRGAGNRPPDSKPRPVNLGLLAKKFGPDEVVNRRSLIEKGIIKKGESVKILSSGDLDKSIIIKGLPVSRKVVNKVKEAGGKTE